MQVVQQQDLSLCELFSDANDHVGSHGASSFLDDNTNLCYTLEPFMN